MFVIFTQHENNFAQLGQIFEHWNLILTEALFNVSFFHFKVNTLENNSSTDLISEKVDNSVKKVFIPVRAQVV